MRPRKEGAPGLRFMPDGLETATLALAEKRLNLVMEKSLRYRYAALPIGSHTKTELKAIYIRPFHGTTLRSTNRIRKSKA